MNKYGYLHTGNNSCQVLSGLQASFDMEPENSSVDVNFSPEIWI